MADIRLTETAGKELAHAIDWYGSKSSGARDNFVKEYYRLVSVIKGDPLRYAKLNATHRACKFQGYPYILVYREFEAHLLIVAIAHTSRQPGYWKVTGENES